jgi:predicted alpha/beta superfamily hydrolase
MSDRLYGQIGVEYNAARQAICNLLFIFFPFCLLAQSKSNFYNAPIDTILASKYLSRNEEITISLPRAFSKDRPSKFPVIIVFDRQNQMEYREIFESINYLVSFGGMPESVIIGIKSDNGNGRLLESSFLPSRKDAQGEQMLGFICDELIPWAETHLNTNKNRIFIGHSRFGYFTSYLLQDRLTELTGVISCSPFFTQKNINVVDSLKEKLEKKHLTHEVYYRFITGDSVWDSKDYLLMKSALSNEPVEHFNWKGTAYYAAGHFLTPGLSVMQSLFDIFDHWNSEWNNILINDTLSFTANDYDVFTGKMQYHYGDKLGVGLAQLRGVGYGFYGKKRYDAAIETWKIMMKEFPTFPEGYVDIGKAYKKEGKNAEATKNFNEALLLLKTSAFYNSEEKQELIKEIEDLQNAKD